MRVLHTPSETLGPSSHPPLLSTLQTLLTESPTPLTCRELLDRWPGFVPRPDSLWRTLARGVELGQFTAAGKGTKTEPFRFAVARRVEETQVAAGQQQPCEQTPKQV